MIREGVPSIVNPFDEYALERALNIRDNQGGKITVITMGPPQATEALRKCLAMGADEAILISDRGFAGSDTWSTSYTLASAIKTLGKYDIIFCGIQAIDGDTAQVGPGIAEHLKISQVTYVQRIVSIDNNKIELERAIEGGYELIEALLPTVLTIDKNTEEPRLPTMMGTMKSLKKEIRVLTAKDIGVEDGLFGMEGSPTRVKLTFSPQARSGGRMLEGELEEMVQELASFLRNEKIV